MPCERKYDPNQSKRIDGETAWKKVMDAKGGMGTGGEHPHRRLVKRLDAGLGGDHLPHYQSHISQLVRVSGMQLAPTIRCLSVLLAF